MFSELAKLLESGNRVVLTLDKVGEELVVSASAVVPVTDTSKACALRNALAKPVTFRASPAELDAEFASSLSQYVDTFVTQASNLDEVTKDVASSKASGKKGKNASKDDKASQEKQSAPKADSTPKPSVSHTVNIDEL